jgi:hypothetical protein
MLAASGTGICRGIEWGGIKNETFYIFSFGMSRPGTWTFARVTEYFSLYHVL